MNLNTLHVHCQLPSHSKKVVFILVLFLVYMNIQEAAGADRQPGSITCTYAILLEGKRVGHTESTRKETGSHLASSIHTETTTSLQVKGLLGTWTLDSRSVMVQDQTGVSSFDHKINEDGQRWHLFGERYKDSLWCSARKIQTNKEKEDEALLGLATHTATRSIPYVGETLMVLNLLDSGDSEQGDVAVPLDRFDVSQSRLPDSLWLIPPGEQKPLKVFDTTELKIVTVRATASGNEQLSLANHQFACRLFDLRSKDGHSTHWIAKDSFGPFLVKEEGEDSDGQYALTLEQYSSNK